MQSLSPAITSTSACEPYPVKRFVLDGGPVIEMSLEASTKRLEELQARLKDILESIGNTKKGFDDIQQSHEDAQKNHENAQKYLEDLQKNFENAEKRFEDMTQRVLQDAWSITLEVTTQTPVDIPEWLKTFDAFKEHLKDNNMIKEEILRKWNDKGKITVDMPELSHEETAIFCNWHEAKRKFDAERKLIDTDVGEDQKNYKNVQKALEDAEQEVLKDAWRKIQVDAKPEMREGNLDWFTTFDAFEASLNGNNKADILRWWRGDFDRRVNSEAELSNTQEETLEQWRKVRAEKLGIEVDLIDANADVFMATPEWLECKKEELKIKQDWFQGEREKLEADIKRLKAEKQTLQGVERKPEHSLQQGYRVLLSDLLSGTIITMWADLREFGFSESKQERWFVVLGKLATTTGYVLLPMATFGGGGKSKLDDFTAEYFKDLKSSTYNHGDDIFKGKLSPNKLVYSEKRKSRNETVLALATAFVVEPDTTGYIPAKIDGRLERSSFKDVFACYKHLAKYHGEYEYLLQNNIHNWDQNQALSTLKSQSWFDVTLSGESCDARTCSLGKIIGSKFWKDCSRS